MTSSLEARFACPGDSATFSCAVEEASSLRWIAVPFINVSNSVTFTPRDSVGDGAIRTPFTAFLTSVSALNPLSANLTSDLYINDVSRLGSDTTVTIQCIDPTNTAAANLSVESKLNNNSVSVPWEWEP